MGNFSERGQRWTRTAATRVWSCTAMTARPASALCYRATCRPDWSRANIYPGDGYVSNWPPQATADVAHAASCNAPNFFDLAVSLKQIGAATPARDELLRLARISRRARINRDEVAVLMRWTTTEGSPHLRSELSYVRLKQ